ncbi:hypothetical protein AVEN_16134-1 [Araneus ventricosus]|uniref:Uncharacterized protein n=1 Tax=Araneus ventricosus TaxID=182803 RepID=A0A4Y2MEC1_ARAVE|nr:hypothetical protein AVEN_16134-1 [Araneus ventricosus]
MHHITIETTKKSAIGHSDPLLHILSTLSKRQPPPAPISCKVREPHFPPHVSASTAFQHLWPGSTNGVVRYPYWLEIITCAPRRSKSHRYFCTDDRIWRGAV